ncbi:MAG: uroporphyrinogen-III C-methyltransferase [Planctomycetaceae bacterium]|nr:uroporphyrinogen-III C-methyltransferase [Planctomycetaceae bacterium]
MSSPPPSPVYLIGAGPGDPGLLTLRGRDLLARADVVLYDYLANPRLLEHARADAELTCLGRHGQGRLLGQDEVNAAMIAAARSGRTVARLKGGDCTIFGRLAEEVAALEAAGIPYEVVPGVTAAAAASAYAGVPLTHRDAASCVAFVTGQQSDAKTGAPLDLAALARFPGTLVFYMGVTGAPRWAPELITHGKSAATPAAIVRHASLPQQWIKQTTLGELANELAPGKVRPPAIIVVGDAVAASGASRWFARRPLLGQTVLVTRPAHQAAGMVAQLEELGARALVQPAIEIGPPADPAPLHAAIERLGDFHWVVFSSANGVAYFLDALQASGRDLRALGGVKLAAIGPATVAALAQRGLAADVQPDEYRAEQLATALEPAAAAGEHFLLVRASRGRETLHDDLTAAGGSVTQAVAYESRDVTAAEPTIAEQLAAGEIDWVTATSSAIARSLVALFGDSLHRTKLAAISPLTAGVLTDAGLDVAAVAEQYTSDGLIEALAASAAAE